MRVGGLRIKCPASLGKGDTQCTRSYGTLNQSVEHGNLEFARFYAESYA